MHPQLVVLGQMTDHVIRVDDLYIVIDLDISRRNRTDLVRGQRQGRFASIMHPYSDILEVQQNLNNIFLKPFNRGVLMKHPLDFSFSNRRAGNRR